MNVLFLFFSPRRVKGVARWWGFCIPFLIATTLWFALFDKIRFIFMNSNLLTKFIELNFVTFLYIAILSGFAVVFEKDRQKSMQLPFYFLPYLFLPIYVRILQLFDLKPLWAFQISFLHSIFISVGEYGYYYALIRAAGNIVVSLVVREWV